MPAIAATVPGCLERRITVGGQERIQYYHRYVAIVLVSAGLAGDKRFHFLLDLEPQRSGEDEVTCSLRLLARVLQLYPHAFDLLLADALYAQAPFFNFLLAQGKHALVVLKDERRDLYQGSAGLFAQSTPQPGQYGSRQCSWWDDGDLRSWSQVLVPLRVVRSKETYSVKRQLDGKPEQMSTEWVWVTTLPASQFSTERLVYWGHQRWDIENYAFNELVSHWHADHVYTYDANAIECFLLELFLAFNVFQAFLFRNLKSQLQSKHTKRFWAELIAAELRVQVCPHFSHPEHYLWQSLRALHASAIDETLRSLAANYGQKCCQVLSFRPCESP